MINWTQVNMTINEAQKQMDKIGFLPLAGIVFCLFIIGLIVYEIFFRNISWKTDKMNEVEL